MSKGVHLFKQGDVAKALKAARAAGFGVERIEVDRTGKFVVVLAGNKQDVAVKIDAVSNEWDSILG
jgi:hypothetical protein